MNQAVTEKPVCFYLATLMVHYKDQEGQLKVRYMNSLLESPKPQLLKSDIGVMHQSALARLAEESGIDPSSVVDTVVMNLSMLAITTPEIFHGTVAEDNLPEDAPAVN
tara:strand:- start:9213 stop:9536 length:324 start_codon:yes stop_codon:yes gene_type:complete